MRGSQRRLRRVSPQAVPGEHRGARWGAGGGLGVGTEAGRKDASELPEQPPLQHFMLLLGRLTHHLPGEKVREMSCRADTGALSGTPAPPHHSLVPPCTHLPITGFDGFDHHSLLGVHLGATLLWAGLCGWEDTGDGTEGTCGMGAQQ